MVKIYLRSKKLHDFQLKHGQLNEKIYIALKISFINFFYKLKEVKGSDNNHLKSLGYQQSPGISSWGKKPYSD